MKSGYVLAGVFALTLAGHCLAEAKGQSMSAKNTTHFTMSSWEPWNDTGLTLQKGHTYRFTAHVKEGEKYRDDKLPCTPDGPNSFLGRVFDAIARNADCPLNPAHWFGPGKVKHLRVLQDRTGRKASFLTLVAAIGRNDERENVYVIGKGRTFTAHTTGRLFVFSNDWPGGRGTTGEARFTNSKTYANNKGRLVVKIEEL